MKSENQIPQIIIPSLESYVKGDSPIGAEEQYSILKNARRDESEIAEIASALGDGYIADLVTFPPRRLGFFETIVTIETEVKLRNESDLALIVNKIYKEHIVPLLKGVDPETGKKLEDKILEEAEQEIISKIDLAFADFKASEIDGGAIDGSRLGGEQQILLNEIREVYTKIKTRIDRGEYTPGECSFTDDLDSITKKIVFDRLYNKMMSKKITELVKPRILGLLEEKTILYPETEIGRAQKPLEKLSCHQGEDRHTFMMSGAPASGKGTAFGMVMIDADNLGIKATDLVKSNTDTYRHLVSNAKELGDNTIHHASFNFDESYLITRRVYNRLKEKMQNPEGAPHILIDTVHPTQEKINLGITDGGKLHLYCVSVHAEVSIKRAFSRGKKTGRYIDRSLLLKSHRDISRNLHRILIDNKDKSIDYILVDNNVSPGEIPILVAEGNLSEKTITIHDWEKFKQFIDKENINLDATTKENLYLAPREDSPGHRIDELRQAGFAIECKDGPRDNQLNAPHLKKRTKPGLRAELERRSSSPSDISNSSVNIPRKKRAKIKVTR